MVSLLVASTAQGSVTFQADVETHIQPGKGAQGAPSDASASFRVTLGGDYLLIQSVDGTMRFDFTRFKRVEISADGRSRVDYSLYDTIGFRVMELRNREMLGKMLASVKVGDKLMSTVENEHVLAVQEKASSPLKERAEGEEDTYRNDGKILFRRSNQTTEVSPADARMFAQFIRYQFGGHPQILNDLANAKSIPAQITLITNDGREITRRISVKSLLPFEGVPMDVAVIPGRSSPASIDPVDQALDRGAAIVSTDYDAAKQRVKDDIALAFREHRVFDAFLGSLEWSLMTGEGLSAIGPDEMNQAKQSEPVQRLAAALGVKSKDGLADAAKTIADLKSTTLSKKHVLTIFEANDRAMLGDPSTAKQLFVSALSINPYIAGAYKDFGDALLAQFDAPRAWRSWDIGRKLAPTFRNFGAVNQLERSLASEHPEYFLK